MSVYLEPDPGERQRRREISADRVDSAYLSGAPKPHLAAEVQDFASAWLAENVPMEYARPLADAIGRKKGLRAVAREWGVDHRRMSEYRAQLGEALKEVL